MDVISAVKSLDLVSAVMSMAASTTTSEIRETPTAMTGMGMGGSSCKISMLWNWNTIDACFISSTWQIKSKAMFAGSCVSVVCLVISLELLRRLQRAYERHLVRKARDHHVPAERFEDHPPYSGSGSGSGLGSLTSNTLDKNRSDNNNNNNNNTGAAPLMDRRAKPTFTARGHFRLTLTQQTLRALIHMIQFGVAYFIMLLAMYYNGYFIISILLGAFLGFFIFSWDSVSPAAVK